MDEPRLVLSFMCGLTSESSGICTKPGGPSTLRGLGPEAPAAGPGEIPRLGGAHLSDTRVSLRDNGCVGKGAWTPEPVRRSVYRGNAVPDSPPDSRADGCTSRRPGLGDAHGRRPRRRPFCESQTDCLARAHLKTPQSQVHRTLTGIPSAPGNPETPLAPCREDRQTYGRPDAPGPRGSGGKPSSHRTTSPFGPVVPGEPRSPLSPLRPCSPGNPCRPGGPVYPWGPTGPGWPCRNKRARSRPVTTNRALHSQGDATFQEQSMSSSTSATVGTKWFLAKRRPRAEKEKNMLNVRKTHPRLNLCSCEMLVSGWDEGIHLLVLFR